MQSLLSRLSHLNPISFMVPYLGPEVEPKKMYHQKQSQTSPKGQETENPKGPIGVISSHYAADTVSASSETLLASKP